MGPDIPVQNRLRSNRNAIQPNFVSTLTNTLYPKTAFKKEKAWCVLNRLTRQRKLGVL